jgi:hypothetical protein
MFVSVIIDSTVARAPFAQVGRQQANTARQRKAKMPVAKETCADFIGWMRLRSTATGALLLGLLALGALVWHAMIPGASTRRDSSSLSSGGVPGSGFEPPQPAPWLSDSPSASKSCSDPARSQVIPQWRNCLTCLLFCQGTHGATSPSPAAAFPTWIRSWSDWSTFART